MKNSITILFLLCIIPQFLFGQFGAPITIDGSNSVERNPEAILVNGNPASAYRNASEQILFIRSNDALGSVWPASPTLTTSLNTTEGHISLEIVNGNPAIAFLHYDLTNDRTDLYLVRANDANGSVWNTPIAAVTNTFSGMNGFGTYIELTYLDGKPSIFFWNNTENDVKYVRANDSNGTSWGTPVSMGINSFEFEIGLVQGNPAMIYIDENTNPNELKYNRATNVSGTAWGTPITLGTTASQSSGGLGNINLAIIDGKPGVSFFDYANNGILYSIHATDILGTSWLPAPVQVLSGLNQTSNAGIFNDIEYINGRPAIAYMDGLNNSDHLRYVPALTTDGLLWDPTTYLLDIDASDELGQDMKMLKLSNGLPGIIYLNFTQRSLKYVRATANIPPSNDSVCEAYEMQTVVPFTYNMNNKVANTQANEPQPSKLANCDNQYSWCQTANITKTLWYKFVAPSSGNIEIITGSNDTNIALYETASCTDLLTGNYTLLAANDNFFGTNGSKIEDYRCLNPGDTYYVQVEATDADGNFTLLINPLNDPCPVAAFLESCGSGTINPPNPNWHGQITHIKNGFGDIYASIIDNGNDLGNVTVDFEFVNTFRGSGTQTYSGKTWTITPTNQPTSNVTLRLYILDIEFMDMQTNNPNINSINDLYLRRVSGGSCGDYAGGGDVFAPVSTTTFNSNHYCLEYSIPGFSSFYLQGGSGALPVELSKFEGFEAGNFNILKWETASETNTKSFKIECSSDGLNNWNKIGTIGANGNSIETQSYQFTDRQPLTKAYYRLRSVDFDGKTNLSHIIYIERMSETGFGIYPNPANEVLYLNFGEENYLNGEISVFDLNGKLVQKEILNNSNQILNITDLNNGIYFLEIEKEGHIWRKRFLKQ